MSPFFRTTTLAALLLSAVSAHAAIQSYNFSGTLDSGYYKGESYTGSFSFDDAAMTGIGDEWLAVASLSMDILGNHSTLTDADVPAEVGYKDGAFLGLSYSVSSIDPQFTLIAGSIDASDAFLAYDTAAGFSGAGSLVYTTAPVPEPETWSMLIMGLGLIGLRLRHKFPVQHIFGA